MPATPSSAPPVLDSTSLPLAFGTGDATRVITVVADSDASTSAVVQAWQKSGSGWIRYGSAVPAEVGSDGLSTHASESLSATPIGSFTLTQAFGHDPNPGTSLPYLQTTPADWWISQYGGAYAGCYNTLQTGPPTSACPYDDAAGSANPNEHLYYEMPYYTYAVVIDYNRSPVVQGAGSAFFLHVSVGQPTASRT